MIYEPMLTTICGTKLVVIYEPMLTTICGTRLAVIYEPMLTTICLTMVKSDIWNNINNDMWNKGY